MSDGFEDLVEQIMHELDLVLDEDLVAFFAVTISKRPVGDDLEIFPTITIISSSKLTAEEKIKLSEHIVRMGQRIRQSVAKN